MNLKKLIGMVMVVFTAILVIGAGNAYAANASYILGINNVRQTGGAYGIGGLKSDGTPTKKVWKIVAYPTMESDVIDYSNAFYCIKAEHGFMTQSGTTNVTTVKKTYNQKYDMKSEAKITIGDVEKTEKQIVLEKLNSIGVFTQDKTSYNKVMWILDNMYLPKTDGAENYKIELLTKAGIIDEDYTVEHARITDDDIEVVQQMALWYFTNPNDSNYNGERLPQLYFNDGTGIDSGYENFEDLYNTDSIKHGRFRQEECEMLYTYFLTNAKTKGNYVSKDTVHPLTLDKTRVVLAEENENYILGPFRINQNSDALFTLNKLSFTNEAGSSFEYALLDENKVQVQNNQITNMYGKDFYIKVRENLGISNINFDLSITYTKTNATYYTTDEATYKNEQPVVLVEKTPVTYNDKVTIQMPAPKVFDLSLRKFITKINGQNVAVSREPVVDITPLANGTSTTAIYNHPKAPLGVEIGDIVTYTIRVYNEGEKDGYVSEITEHLPAQLEFLPDDEENIANGWIYDENDVTLRTIKTSHLSRDVETSNLIKAFDGKALDYKEVSVKCKVVSSAGEGKRIVNIADITGFTNKDGSSVIDRDSQGKNVVLPSDEELPNYKQEEINRGDKYIPGQQDDDDFDNIIMKSFDLALRKFISSVNGVKPDISREPTVDITPLVNGTSTTAIYNHPKAPLSVEVGDIVTYTIRVYNEADQDGYASEITDHLPAQLEFLPDDEENKKHGWKYDETDNTKRTIKTNYLSKENNENNIIKAFDGQKLDYKEIKVKCKVVAALNFDKRIVNIADITDFTDKNGNPVIDRDSQSANVVLPSDENLPNYKSQEINRGDKYIPGQQDDDDFDSVRIAYFDLALRKFITSVNGKVMGVSREPVANVTPLVNGTSTTAIYNHPKNPVEVQVGDIVTYTIRVYNEGKKDGYVSEITDHLPAQLEFLPDDKENIAKGWKYDETDETKRTIKTSYLSKENNENNIIKAFDGKTLSYKEISVKCKVVADAKFDKRIVNIADITGFTDKNGKPTKDIDSQDSNVVLPNDENLPKYKQEQIDRGDKYIPGQQDDDDFDSVKIVYFDLALRKFITKVDNLDINNRYPALSMGEDGNIKYTHTKEPVLVANGNIVTYTIRIYNEGTMAGFASEITDDLPDGLLFLPENDTNKAYGWKMIDKDGNVTEDVQKAVKITTNHLSKEVSNENLLNAFDEKAGLTENNPDFKDVKVAFKVTEPNTSDRILINTAEISEDTEPSGKPVEDIDSVPGNDKDGEDDIDIDKVKVKYFDLALKKWVTQAIVIENGKQTVTETGHTGNENPEPVVKVDLKAKNLNKVTVKFKYKIKVTNEGQIEGYVKELKDYIPDGLKFVASDNLKWKQISDKQVTTDQVKDLLLKPGESTTVDIVLTWENSDKNLGVKVNWAEISKDYNNYDDTPDIDSTPNNNKQGEDDIDNAPVILSVKTGEMTIYFGLTTIILITLAGGIYLIKKFVL